MFIGIDQSKRSTAVVAINSSGELKAYKLISPSMEIDGERLIDFQWHELNNAICQVQHYHGAIKGIALEGLSFNAVGSGKDVLAGLYWYIRTRLLVQHTHIPVGSIPVTAWRSKVISASERKALPNKSKDAIKKATVAKLPFEVRVKFEQYVREGKFKPAAMYDLADAYFIAQYRLSLEEA